MPTLHIDDATEHLVGYLRDEITKPPPRMPMAESKYGCDLWLPIVVRNFWHDRDPAFGWRVLSGPENPDAAKLPCRVVKRSIISSLLLPVFSRQVDAPS
jgi:hypothetical protein